MSRSTILNLLIEHFGYTSYLEIGLGESRNFKNIKCELKIGVDPDPEANATYTMTSDDFFEMENDPEWNVGMKWDLIFIDGLHHADQVTRDIHNSLAVLSENGTIVLHDCNPKSEIVQAVPRNSLPWMGDVWKAFVAMRIRPDLNMFTVNTDCGCGVIRRGKQEPMDPFGELTYERLEQHRQKWLNLIPMAEFVELLERRSFIISYSK